MNESETDAEMEAWAGAAGMLIAYDIWQKHHGGPMACTWVRNLQPEDKAVAVAIWVWAGAHLFLRKGNNQ